METIHTTIRDSLVNVTAETHDSLALKYWKLFEQSGQREELDTSITHDRTALKLRPDGHPDRSKSLCNLAVSLSTRYRRLGQSEDLEEAIKMNRAALEFHPEDHPDRPTSLNNLASSLSSRYERHGRKEDLEEAIKLERAALELRPGGHPDRSTSLINLASSLMIRYQQFGRTEDLEEASDLQRDALKLSPEDHPHRSMSLNNLANSVRTRFEKYGRTEDLEKAIELERAALELRPAGHPDRSTSLNNLAATLSILQHVLTVNPTLHAQHDFLLRNSDHRVLSLDAASYAAEKSQLEQAIEILEQGRGLLWSQLRGLRHPLDQLAETNGKLADRFRNVSRQLEDLATSHEALASGSDINRSGSHRLDGELGQKSFDELLKLKKKLSHEQQEIMNDIRRVPGFENFLEATPFRVLQRAASDGPVIMVNHCKYRCDALIILSRSDFSVVCVPLDVAFYEDSINQCNELLEAPMKMLWDRVVSKVIEKLTEVGIAEGSRIWWCPTSVLAALPFHAAGPFTDADGTPKYLLDNYVSSYTPTLGALINARSNGNSIEPKLLIVGDTKTLKSTR
ncbi:uncharacterized protein FOMMEDRAFT_115279 [Fomitiporia mediterranea MF3/22]|uniref:TPR-like protein n=1 Tax=Fomitiporia mediterranea (strain MF3/22) TaxID=694068 RepID=R7SHF6_FOMME|nr:uncharacterized protein FOMMEDRAFT_115279 [Fomitiporia mediterranea MF3/22]EJC97712.1 hypothetical protein FOMMEDRAFT_115279 [Fomitiporia mediterranea MF3/22]